MLLERNTTAWHNLICSRTIDIRDNGFVRPVVIKVVIAVLCTIGKAYRASHEWHCHELY